MTRRQIILMCVFLLQTIIVCGQTKTYKDFYPSGQLKIIGQLKDSIKIGTWTYFKPNGKLLAKGQFTEGKKTGRWKYIDYKNRKNIKHFDGTYKCNEVLSIDEKGNLIISDACWTSGCTVMYVNGKFMSSASW